MADICDRDPAAILAILALSRTDLSALQFLLPFIHKIMKNKKSLKIPKLRRERSKKEQSHEKKIKSA